MTCKNGSIIHIEYQGYVCEKIENDEKGNEILKFKSERKTAEEICPHCGGKVNGNGIRKIKLTDIPKIPGVSTIYEIHQHRYRCPRCKKTHTEANPFKIKGFNLTKRCITWIFQLLKYKISTSDVANIMGISWNTVRKLDEVRMNYILDEWKTETQKISYRPYYLAVDEFAIRKGHQYATCVMDLVRGDILWVGKGRSIKDFNKFFETFNGTDYLSSVKAVAMDMNASYNTLVKQYLPQAEIVYDRYHVQAQFGRDVLGRVRLDAAREHKNKAEKMKSDGVSSKEEIKEEKKLYSKLKKARWVLLHNNCTLKSDKQQSLNEILNSHSDLAVCYAMKEELCELFVLTDEVIAKERWTKWFDAAINSGITALANFARRKLKRLDGLLAHAKFQINTGKLEGFNNKIKVAKRNAYGFRNTNFFFSYIRFLSLPTSFVHQNL